jgi:hypothetical protein
LFDDGRYYTNDVYVEVEVEVEVKNIKIFLNNHLALRKLIAFKNFKRK